MAISDMPRSRREWSLRRTKLLTAIGTYAVLIVVVAFIVFPIYWMIATSLKLPREISRLPSLWPDVFTDRSYRELIEERDFLVNVMNSLIVAPRATAISLFISSFAAYSIVRFKYRFMGVTGRITLFAYLMPTSLLFIPLSILMARMKLGNSLG